MLLHSSGRWVVDEAGILNGEIQLGIGRRSAFPHKIQLILQLVLMLLFLEQLPEKVLCGRYKKIVNLFVFIHFSLRSDQSISLQLCFADFLSRSNKIILNMTITL
jgi:hypothetical protein